jgi:hypothetical protein
MTHKNQRKSRYANRKNYEKEYLDAIASKYLDFSGDGYINPFTGKTHKTLNGLKSAIAMYLLPESLNYYIFLVANPICNICKKNIDSYEHYCYHRTRCFACLFDDNGNKKKIWSTESREAANRKISEKRKELAKTERGKQIYKDLGEHNSKHLKEYFQTEEGKEQIKRVAEKQSLIMKEKIKNGTFTPNITNNWTNWDAKIVLDDGNIVKFRSSWEACFWFSNQHLLYEKFRIPYSMKGEDRTYIADFFDDRNRILYEIKPMGSFTAQIEKMQGAIEYCLNNDIDFIWINEHNIMMYIDCSIFEGENKKQLDMMMKGIRTDEKTTNKIHQEG